MKGRVVVLDHLQGHEAAALMVDGRLHDFLIAGPAPLPGTIYRARAAAFIPWIGGSPSAIVGLPLAETAHLLAAAGVAPPPRADRA